MTQPSQSDRRRLVEALGLGPLWMLRERAARVATIAFETPPDWEALQRMVSTGRAAGLRSAQLPELANARIEWLVVVGPPVDHGEDAEAFAGPAGRLLDAMLAAIALDRDGTVFVTSLETLGTRGDAVATSPSCLESQIALLAPRMILAVGEVAVTAMFPDAAHFDDFRGKPHALTIVGRDIPVVATFHPARLLDDGTAKARAWADLCLARAVHEEQSTAALV